MKIAFKVINILIIVMAAISVIYAFLKVGILGAGIALVLVLVELFMAIAGFKENYSLCKKLSFVCLVFSVIGVFTSGFSGSSIFSLILMIGYVVMCISLESKSY